MIPITDHVVDQAVLEKAIAHFRANNIILPTFAEQRDPGAYPGQDQGQAEARSASGTWTRSTCSASPGRTSRSSTAACSAASTI